MARVSGTADIGKRLGIVVPSVNTVVEPWFTRTAPAGLSVHAARMFLADKLTAEGVIEMDRTEGMQAVRQIASCRPVAVAYCCTASSIIQGREYDEFLRRKVEALESRATAPEAAAPAPAPAPSAPSPEQEKELATLRLELATMRNTVQTMDQTIAVQRDQTKLLAEAVDKARGEASARNAGEQKAMSAARASALIGIAARLSAAVESGLPFATDLALLAPLAQGDAKLAESATTLQAYAQNGVAARAALVAEFPAVAKAARE